VSPWIAGWAAFGLLCTACTDPAVVADDESESGTTGSMATTDTPVVTTAMPSTTSSPGDSSGDGSTAGDTGTTAASTIGETDDDSTTGDTDDGTSDDGTTGETDDDTSDDGTTDGTTGDPLPCGIDCSSIVTMDCQVGVCDKDSGLCVIESVADDTPCDDGLFCTVDDVCVAGVCQGGAPNDCGLVPEACDLIACDEAAQVCSIYDADDDAPCVSDNLCNLDSTCVAGECVAGSVVDCAGTPAPDECNVMLCNPGSGECEPVAGNDGDPCVDVSDLCLEGSTCLDGVCGNGVPVDCSSIDEDCGIGVCDPSDGVCTLDPIPPGESCALGTDDCNDGTCDMDGNCVSTPVNEGGACEDGSSCTTGTTCAAGVCQGGMSTIDVYFSEDFSSNAAGWTLDTNWQIGPAMASPSPGACGPGDPGVDTTPSADNGIAGVIIGGNAPTTVHPFYYITSPPIDVSTVPGPVFLSFNRWLNSDYTRYMQNRVEVYDGTSWVVLWESGPSPAVSDSDWTLQSFDISAYTGPNTQIRFGYEVGSSGAYTCSGWNLDDVVVAGGVCQ